MKRCTSSIPPPRASRRACDVDAKLLAWGRAAESFRDRYPPLPQRHPRARPGDQLNHDGVSIDPRVKPGDDGGGRVTDGSGNAAGSGRSCGAPRIPALWLFTDSRRLPNPLPSVARLPRGRAGVVFRHDDHPDRAALGRDIARICRARGLLLVVAGDVRLAAALRAGVHLRGGRWPGPVRGKGFVTSSAHCLTDLRRAARSGACLAFLSPVFATPSHPGAAFLGPVRWSALARRSPVAVAALGGVDGVSARRLPLGLCVGVGAIGALA
jgi:thiamine-phosphate pyrophosphorylase